MSDLTPCSRRLAASAALTLLAVAPAMAKEPVASVYSDAYQPVDAFIVTYREGSAGSIPASHRAKHLERSLQAAFGNARRLTLTQERTLGTGAALMRTNGKLDLAEAKAWAERVAIDPDVVRIEPDVRFHASFVPNDPLFSQQYALQNGVGGARAVQAWDSGAQGQERIVAVVDSGIAAHPDLDDNRLPGYDFIANTFVANDGNGRDADASDPGDWNGASNECYPGSPPRNSGWHGTHLAGIVAAAANDRVGVAGIAFRAKILPVRVLGRCGGAMSDIADAIQWASGAPVPGVPPVGASQAGVIVLGFTALGPCSPLLQTVINGAVNRGVAVVAGAGNQGANSANYMPANCSNVIVAAASNINGQHAAMSNDGAAVDVHAPGVNILSTLNSGTTTPAAPTHAIYSGTSMAASYVAGMIALMQSKAGPDPSPAQAESIVKTSARTTPSGIALIDANAAVEATP